MDSQKKIEAGLPRSKKMYDFSRRRLTQLPFVAKKGKLNTPTPTLDELPQGLTVDSRPRLFSQESKKNSTHILSYSPLFKVKYEDTKMVL